MQAMGWDEFGCMPGPASLAEHQLSATPQMKETSPSYALAVLPQASCKHARKLTHGGLREDAAAHANLHTFAREHLLHSIAFASLASNAIVRMRPSEDWVYFYCPLQSWRCNVH